MRFRVAETERVVLPVSIHAGIQTEAARRRTTVVYYALERLEILKSEEARFQVSEDHPDIADVVISYAKLTAFGVEVFRECVGLSKGGKLKPHRKKRAFAAAITGPVE